ncbi:hypothetical protein EDB84DRAFT_1567351 [Lactarius hengduanensis]|nr:hypothetical protein EDB84DRAFT_1567351 [Lactarius hengduanensis]
MRLIGIRSSLSQPRSLGCRELLLPSQRYPFGPRQYIWCSVSCLRGAMRHLHSCRRLPDPRFAALRLNYWASAAGLYVGIGTFMESALRQHSASGMYCPLPQAAHRHSSPKVSVWCAASSSVSGDDGERPREYLAFRVVYDWAFVSGDFSNSPSLCVFGAITTIGLGEGTKLENGSLESVHFRWTMLVSASAWLTVLTTVPGLQSLLVYSFSLAVRVARGDFPSALRYDVVSQWENVSPVGISGSVGPRAVIVDCTRYPHFG